MSHSTSPSPSHWSLPSKPPSASPSSSSASTSKRKITVLGDNKEQNMGNWKHNPLSSAFQPFESSIRTVPDISSLSFSDKASSTDSHNIRKRDSSVFGEICDKASFKIPPRLPTTPSTTHSLRNSASPSSPFSFFSPGTTRTECSPITPFTPFTPEEGDLATDRKGDGLENKGHQQIEARSGGLISIERPEEVGRYLMISGIPRYIAGEQLQAVLRTMAVHKLILAKHIRKGFVFVAFFDPREALKMYRHLQSRSVTLSEDFEPFTLQCMRVDRDVVEKEAVGMGVDARQVWKYSESIVVIEVVGGFEVQLKDLENILTRFGEVMWSQEIGRGRKFMVEYFDTRQAAYATSYLNNLQVKEARFLAHFHSSDMFAQPRSMSRAVSEGASSITLGSSAYTPGAFGRFQATRMRADSDPFIPLEHNHTAYDHSMTAPSSRLDTPIAPLSTSSYMRHQYTVPECVPSQDGRRFSQPGNFKITPGASENLPYATPPSSVSLEKRMNDLRAGAQPTTLDMMDRAAVGVSQLQGYGAFWSPNDRQGVPEQNRVVPERIISGLDPRTTVMVKDVPNKLSRQEMVNILNEVVPGGFDFVYLRFDFNNCCNVGYAFVNFTSVKSLYEFIVAKVGKKWNMFSSEKVLQLSYANIQGKSALINKFRNSAVMTVIEQWRPQIFYSSGAMQGLPEPFPEPDNLAQRQRSSQIRLSALESAQSPQYSGRDIYDYDYAPSMLERGF